MAAAATEILDVNIGDEGDTEFQVDEAGDTNLAELKEKVRRRKGRGFDGEGPALSSGVGNFEALETEGGGAGPQRSVEGWILFITNVHEEATEDDIVDKFSDYGEIKNLHLNLDRRTGFIKGYALVEYQSFKEAEAALDALNGSDLLGQAITVDWGFTKGSSSSGGKRRRDRRSGRR